MNKKNYIKLNNTNNHLSIGNIFRIIKDETSNKTNALQSELFYIIFDVEDVSMTTINNYCTGIRPINSHFKEKYLKLYHKYEKDNSCFKDIILQIVFLLDSKTIEQKKISFENSLNIINNSNRLYKVCLKLYNIAKNDNDIDTCLKEELKKLLDTKNLYLFMIKSLYFAIIDKKQPIYIEDTFISTLNNALYSTNLSSNDIIDFVTIQLNGGIWSMRGIYELAKKNNPYACFEMGSLELYGQITGTPRYFESYQYFKRAAKKNHPNAIWAIGYMHYNGYIGTKSRRDYIIAFRCFNKARKYNCLAAINGIGTMFLHGNVPFIQKNEKKAIKLFEYAAKNHYIYAFNNLGTIYEKRNELKKAFQYYLKAANLGESWACNKVGEFYRKGIFQKKNLKKAFEYYNKACEASIYSICFYAKYNLAHYFYKNGCIELNIPKDINKAIALLEEASKNQILNATEDLIYIYYSLYRTNLDDLSYLTKAKYYAKIVETLPTYNNDIKNRIENNLKNLKLIPSTDSIQF
ncbi:MAG: tetratricopeptide repeat protein [Clostridia bacterium]|nr:tetratricopeptide repeat protein [Clostridia bacterium]